MTTPPLVPSFGGQPPQLQHQQQAQAARDVNTSSLCRIGQETVQDIVLRTMEIFQLLRNMQVCLALFLPVKYRYTNTAPFCQAFILYKYSKVCVKRSYQIVTKAQGDSL